MIVDKCAEAELQPGCMTQHPGFEAVCLNPWVLQVEYASLVQYYGDYDQDVFTIEERYRHTAYRTFVRWCWGYLGRKIRVVLPSCVVVKIRSTFTSERYTGFKLPSLHPQ
uniref:P2X purinoreceptor 7 intracellular domain-containing protein n=1 Tax=Cyprinus carpio TaxID=7962 RepID=A0A8C1GC49_CYPCA